MMNRLALYRILAIPSIIFAALLLVSVAQIQTVVPRLEPQIRTILTICLSVMFALQVLLVVGLLRRFAVYAVIQCALCVAGIILSDMWRGVVTVNIIVSLVASLVYLWFFFKWRHML